MNTIQTVALSAHTLIAILVIVLVLLQRGKGADAGAAFGAGASGTVFGARGSASFFSRATAVLATLFFVSSLGLAYLSSQQTEAPESLLDSVTEEARDAEPASRDADALPSLDVPPEAAENDTIEALPAVEEEPQPEE
ncbi:MAG: preprotein translocase subunit SecG [Pseudomonadota bacterium]